MTLFRKSEIPFLVALGLGVIGTFDRPLGLPSDFRFLFLLASISLMVFLIIAAKKAKKQRPAQSETCIALQRQKKLRLLIPLYAISFVAIPFIFPLIYDQKVPLEQLTIFSAIGFVFSAGLTYFLLKKQA